MQTEQLSVSTAPNHASTSLTDNEILLDQIILKVEVGSTAYGTGIPGQEDIDQMAIGIEPKRHILGLGNFTASLTHRPGRKHDEQSQPGDLDLVVHPLKRWMSLALQNNPTVLMALWSQVLESTKAGDWLRKDREVFITKHMFKSHIGYATSQLKRLEAGKYYASRQHIIDKCGYDAKFAMHALRLVMQGQELALNRFVEIPIPEPKASLLKTLRRGDMPQEEFYKIFKEELAKLQAMEEGSTLPDHPPSNWANTVLEDIYLEYYRLDYY